ncbi:MAG: DUF2066 domain-containing protein [Gammaproteobacteria bacterium]|nr:DUF2066 domain-containing protein [Gammaproteobacteria bacterium]
MKFHLSVIALLLTVFPVWAKPVSGLYDARVPVPDQQLTSRQQGAKQGLIEVLQKVSGFSVPAENEAVARALDIADQYLYQFSYEAVQKEEWDASIPPGSSWLKMRFEAQSIQRIIKQAQLPLWGNNRPTVLLWIMKDEGDRTVLIDGAEDMLANAVKDAGDRRGIPVVLPVYDLEDSMRLPQESLWGLFSESILAASGRYDAESVMAARVYKNKDGNWVGQWRFYFKDREFNYDFETEGLNQQVLSGMSAAAEVLANAFAIKPSDASSGTLAIKVGNVKSLNQYAALVSYLDGLTITKGVFVSRVKDTDLELNLTLAGSLAQFRQVLALDRKLILQEAELTGDTQANIDPLIPQVIQFKWQP